MGLSDSEQFVFNHPKALSLSPLKVTVVRHPLPDVPPPTRSLVFAPTFEADQEEPHLVIRKRV